MWRNKTSQHTGRVPEDAGVPWPCQPSCSSKSRGVPPAWEWGRGEGGPPRAAGGSLSRDTAGRAPDSTYQAIPAMLDSIRWQLGNRGVSGAVPSRPRRQGPQRGPLCPAPTPGNCLAGSFPVQRPARWLAPGGEEAEASAVAPHLPLWKCQNTG